MLHEDSFSSIPLPQFYKTPVKHFTKFLWHATQRRAFFAKKVAHGYSYSGAIVNLIRDWRTEQQHNRPNNCHFWAQRGCWGDGSWDERVRSGWRFGVLKSTSSQSEHSGTALDISWESCTMPLWAPTPLAGGCSCACRTHCCHSWGLLGWISRTLYLVWTAPEICNTQTHH